MSTATDIELVKYYLSHNYRLVFWPSIGDAKGPHDKDWPKKAAVAPSTLADYHEGWRTGILTGTEIAPGRWLHDVDLDWAPGADIAIGILPPTGFVFGRPSKRLSHCFYTLPEPLPSLRFEDIDKTCLIELRGTKVNGDVGFQTMAPPSVWSKGGQREPLTFIRREDPAHLPNAHRLKQLVTYAAISMLIAKHLGHHGFGHDVRLMWAGFLLRAGLPPDDLITMGEAMSGYCHNTEVSDVRRCVESTVAGLASRDSKKVKGGPALAKHLGAMGKTVLGRINEWLGRDQDFVRDTKGSIVPKHYVNIARAVEKLGHELSYNEFAEQALIDGKPLEDAQWRELYFDIDKEYRFQPPVDYFKLVIEDIAWRNKFHPVKDYLDGLVWDSKKRIDNWLIVAGGAERSGYVRHISAIMLIAAVRRIRQPGCKYDEMVVWESPQGMEKSSAARALCPDSNWFSDDLRLNLHSKELIEATLGKWIVEASDLAGKRRTEIEQLKAMLSRQIDGPARLAYAYRPVQRPRHFILIGTTNSSAYLTDSTGSRRFWPVKVGRFDVKWIRDHRDQLWAEACERESKGESIRLPEELWPDATVEQDKRREMDPWEEQIRNKLLLTEEKAGRDGVNRRRIATSDLWITIGVPLDKRDRFGAIRIAEIMQRLGFRRTSIRNEKDEVETGYVTEFPHLLELVEEQEHAREREPGEDDDEEENV